MMGKASVSQGPAAVLAWRWSGEGEPETAELAAHLQELQHWAAEQTLELEREEHPRVLALLDQPELAVVLPGSDNQRLAEALHRMARWPSTASVSLLLAPDAQRSNHPSNTLEAQRRPLVELAAEQPLLRLSPGTLMRWC
jgi:3,4-dihydroxy 2-butanone 4-phosphate synthase/GTP cyclohydrolase II